MFVVKTRCKSYTKQLFQNSNCTLNPQDFFGELLAILFRENKSNYKYMQLHFQTVLAPDQRMQYAPSDLDLNCLEYVVWIICSRLQGQSSAQYKIDVV